MSSHFYTPDGTCIHGLREARKVQGAVPSPTTVLSILGSEGLTNYFRRQMFDAVATTPRNPLWNDEQYYDECLKWADQHGDIARKGGGDFHELIENYNKARFYGKPIPIPTERWAQAYRAYVGWFEEHVERVLLVETVVRGEGYAGRLDCYVLLKDGRRAIVDAKTQNKKGRKKFNYYTKHLLQLSAYSRTDQTHAHTLISLYFSSDEPFSFEAYEWPVNPEEAHRLFKAVLAIWMLDNNYQPTKA